VIAMLDAIAKGICGVGLALTLGLATAGCSDTPSPERCEKLLDHVVELQLLEAGQGKDLSQPMKDAVKGQKSEVAAYVRESFLTQCAKLPNSFVDCALAAKTTGEYADCAKD
jgi:hypothetical protein